MYQLTPFAAAVAIEELVAVMAVVVVEKPSHSR